MGIREEVSSTEIMNRVLIVLFQNMPDLIAVRIKAGCQRVVGNDVSFQKFDYYFKGMEEIVPEVDSGEYVFIRHEVL